MEKSRRRILQIYVKDCRFKNCFVVFVLTFLSYVALGHLGLYFASLNQTVSPVWPAAGFAIGMVYSFGSPALAAVLCGAFVVNLGSSFPLAAWISIGNMSEAWVGAVVLAWIRARRFRLAHQSDVLAFGLASIIGAVVAASQGTLGLALFGEVGSRELGQIWLTWWVGDSLGGLFISPLVVGASKRRIAKLFGHSWVLPFLLLLMVLFFAFFRLEGAAFVFFLFPCLLWLIWRGGSYAGTIGAVVISAVALYATFVGAGPFVGGSLNDRLIHLQLFLVAVGLTSLNLGGLKRADFWQLSTLILLLCWTLSGALFYSFERSDQRIQQTHFRGRVAEIENLIVHTFRSYLDTLIAGAAALEVRPDMRMSDWRSFVEILGITSRHSGMNGLGVIFPVDSSARSLHEKKYEAQGLKGFRIKSLAKAESSSPEQENYVITFIEPLEGNEAASGLDVGSEHHRRQAADIARASGGATMTAPIVLVQDRKKSPGFLMYYPVYRAQPIGSSTRQFFAWVYGPVMYEKFFAEVLSRTTPDVEFSVSDQGDASFPQKLFTNLSDPNAEFETTLTLAQRTFQVSWRRSPSFYARHSVVVAWVGFAGAIVSLLVLNILVGLQQVGRRAQVLAERLTSELESSQAKLRRGELRMRYALEGSDDGIWDWDIRKGEMFVDGTIAQRMQWPSVFTVRSIADLRNLAHPDDLVTIEKSIAGLLKSEKVTHEVETRYRTPEGEWRWVLTRGKVSERNSGGKPVRMTGVHIDIHALKVAQSQLEGTKRLLGDIADNIPTLISIWDRDLQCRYVNRAFADWFVVDPNAALEMHLEDFFQQLQLESFLSKVVELAPGQTYHLEMNLRRRSDSSSRQVICLIKAREAQALEGGFYLFIQDITEQKEAELEAIRQRDLAEKAANVKSNFLANMSHEIRTPLNGIIGMTEMISGKIQDPEVSRNLGVLKKSSLSLLRLVNDILDLSKFEAGKTVLESHVFEVNELVEDVLGLFQVRIAEKGLRLVTSSALKRPTYFSGDSLKLRQILTNLIANAVKFTEQGDISVTYSSSELGPGQVSLRFKIADTGIGMDELQLQRLFSPFSQADASTTRRFGGTGLGLAIAKNLVSLMGGRISVQSKLGAGSVFSFDVVMQVAHGLEENPDSSSSKLPLNRPQQDLRILIAEDNEVNRQVVVGFITKLGFRCEVAVNGREAVAAVQSGRFDLVLMDCHMPEMDGFEATQQIRALTGILQPTIIAVSASSLAEDIERCRACGMNGFVGKPIDIQELKRVLAEVSTGVNEHDTRFKI